MTTENGVVRRQDLFADIQVRAAAALTETVQDMPEPAVCDVSQNV